MGEMISSLTGGEANYAIIGCGVEGRGMQLFEGGIDAGDLEVLSKPVTSAAAKVPAATGDVQVVGERSWEQKNAEGHKNAVTLEPDTPRKRSRRQSELLEERVAKARSKLDPAIDQRVKEQISGGSGFR